MTKLGQLPHGVIPIGIRREQTDTMFNGIEAYIHSCHLLMDDVWGRVSLVTRASNRHME